MWRKPLRALAHCNTLREVSVRLTNRNPSSMPYCGKRGKFNSMPSAERSTSSPNAPFLMPPRWAKNARLAPTTFACAHGRNFRQLTRCFYFHWRCTGGLLTCVCSSANQDLWSGRIFRQEMHFRLRATQFAVLALEPAGRSHTSQKASYYKRNGWITSSFSLGKH
jgi:hypothetical protein